MIFRFKGSPQLKREIEAWREDKIISEEQEQILYERYDLLSDAPWYLQSGFFVRALALVLVGMSLILLISENWHHFSVSLRTATCLMPLLLAYAAGVHLLLRNKSQQAELAFFFASIAFGANIFLQAQIYHISAYFPNGILWWLLGSLPFAWYFRSTIHLLLAQVLYSIWMILLSTHSQSSWLAVPLLVLMFLMLNRAPARSSIIGVLVSCFILLINLQSWLDFGTKVDLFAFQYTAALALMVLTAAMRNLAAESFLDRVITFIKFYSLTLLYILTFSEVAEEIRYFDFPWLPFVLWLLTLTALLALPRLRSLGRRDLLVYCGFALPLLFVHVFDIRDRHDFLMMLLFNLTFFSMAVWLIISGMNNRHKKVFMAGITMIFLQAVGRYFDFFSDYLLSALIFFLGGLFLYLINNFWNRRYAS